jgi:hypothetical protein
MKKHTWVGTYLGGRFDPLKPRASDISIVDIAKHLSNLCRYSGATQKFYSVAEHSVLVATKVPRHLRLEALLHDAGEAYIGDMCSGIKHLPEMQAFRDIEAEISNTIYSKFGIVPTKESQELIDLIDKRIVLDEVAVLMKNPEKYVKAKPGIVPLGVKVHGFTPETAYGMFYRAYKKITNGL